MHLVCFIIRIYHVARSPERQIDEDKQTQDIKRSTHNCVQQIFKL